MDPAAELAASLVAAQRPPGPDPRNGPNDAARFAQENAPILVLPTGQYDLPGDPLEFIANSRLQRDNPFELGWNLWGAVRNARDDTLADNTDDDLTNNFGPSRIANPDESNLFMDLDNDMRGELGIAQNAAGGPAPLHFEFDLDAATPTITYYVFYPYNDGPSVQNHEGDWERVTLQLDPDTMEPINAVLSAHTHSSIVPIEDIADPETGRPVVYVAGGSHAIYATPGTHDTEAPGFDDRTVPNPNNVPLSELEDAVIYENWGEMRDVTAQPWYTNEPGNNGVRWGEIGETTHTSGPHGPSAKKGAVPPPQEGKEEGGFLSTLDAIVDGAGFGDNIEVAGDVVEGASDISRWAADRIKDSLTGGG